MTALLAIREEIRRAEWTVNYYLDQLQKNSKCPAARRGYLKAEQHRLDLEERRPLLELLSDIPGVYYINQKICIK